MKKSVQKPASIGGTAIAKPLDFSADAGKGLEGTSKADFAIPFLIMLQGLSPQLETVKGAKPGLMLNTITGELYASIMVIPCAYQRRFVRWAPRSMGGGYRGELSPLDVEAGTVKGLSQVNGMYLMDVPAGATPFDKDGKALYDKLNDTRNHFVLAQSESGAWQPALMSLSSTQIKKSKRWMSRIQGLELKQGGKTFTPPSFSHTYRVTTEKEKNAKGDWWGFAIALDAPIADANLYEAAKRFHDSVVAGTVKVSQPVEQPTAEGF